MSDLMTNMQLESIQQSLTKLMDTTIGLNDIVIAVMSRVLPLLQSLPSSDINIAQDTIDIYKQITYDSQNNVIVIDYTTYKKDILYKIYLIQKDRPFSVKFIEQTNPLDVNDKRYVLHISASRVYPSLKSIITDIDECINYEMINYVTSKKDDKENIND